MGGIEDLIKTAKSLPSALYHLVLINIILFIGLVWKELTLLYLVGSLVFVVLLILAVSKATNVWTVPDELISQEVVDRLNEINEEWKGWIRYMEIKSEASSAISRVITLLLTAYFAALLSTNMEIFIIFNLCFMYVFMPKQIQGIFGIIKQFSQGLLNKIRHRDQ